MDNRINIYIEVSTADCGETWQVVKAEDKFDPNVQYSEIELDCEYEDCYNDDTRAYLSGGEVIEVNVEGDLEKTLTHVHAYRPTFVEDSPFPFTPELLADLDTEAQRRMEDYC